MENLLKNLGVVILLLGAACLVLHYVSVPENWMLVLGIALELCGILTYIFVNKALR